ncbi:MAG: LysR family transcriptional regulator [Paracoccaceae bacterium]|nr:LysR family transcriptional regulator [Paracoccaceae bacterium]
MNEAQFKLPPLEWIRAFEAAARCGSFTAAAAETGVTQPAISQRIGQLEQLFGTALFVRQARSITLTTDGEAWLPHVQSALGAIRDSSEAIFGAGRKRLTISASQSVIDLWLQPRMGQFCDIAGGDLSVQTMVVGAHDAPKSGVIGVRYGTGSWPTTYKLPLYNEQMAVMASPELACRTDPWINWPRITCSGARPGWNDWAAQFNSPTTPVPSYRFDTFLSALGAALAGLGVIVGSLPLCAKQLAEGSLVRLSDDTLDHHETYWLIAEQEAVTRNQWDQIATVIS